MARKSGLGKGLEALIPVGDFRPEGEVVNITGGVSQIPVNQIQPNPHQPRTNFHDEELEELAMSIRQHGIIQPLLVTRSSNPEEFVLIAGERRLLAARRAGLMVVPAIIREANEQERVELALIENVQRADLSPLEAAEAYRQLTEDYGLAHDEIAKRVGKSRVTVTNTLRLLKLSPVIQQALAEGKISEGHARALLGLSSPQAQSAALISIIKNDLTVRKTEELVRKLTGHKPEHRVGAVLSPEYIEIETQLRQVLGTKVLLFPRKKGGRLIIHYYSEEELNALVDAILRSNPTPIKTD